MYEQAVILQCLQCCSIHDGFCSLPYFRSIHTVVNVVRALSLFNPEVFSGSQPSMFLADRSPYWCGYIQHYIQYLVPPCWFGKPESEPLDLPPGYPSWCKYVPESARDMVSQCSNSSAFGA